MNLKTIFYLFICILLASCSDDQLEIANLSKSNSKVTEADMGAQDYANLLNEAILEDIQQQTRGISTKKFPSFFGGSYITDKGELVLLIKGNINRVKEQLHAYLQNSNIKFKSCKYSYNELDTVMNCIYEFMTGKQMLLKEHNVLGAAIIDDKNIIEVYLKNTEPKDIEEFKKEVCDNPSIIFKTSYNAINQTGEIDLSPGGIIPLTMTGIPYGSIGFRAMNKSNTTQKGIVTAGHVANVGQSIVISNKIAGVCSQSCQGPYVDAAFIPVENSNFNLSNYFVGDLSSELSTQTSSPGVGTTINMRGATTGHSSGKIISTNAIQDFKGIVYNNLSKATYKCDSGDSGGIVYSYVSSKNLRYTVGIHKGAVITNGTTYAFYSKADLVLNTLNLTRY